MALIIQILINAALITFLFPRFKGFKFDGHFGHGLLYALGLELMGILFAMGLMFFALATLGLGLIVLVPLLLLGFWLISAIELKMLAFFFPQRLAIDGWLPAILAGLCLMVVSMLLGGGPSITFH